ncbi:hypothetical protein D3C73_1672230 [compost metagenome]
MDEQGDGKPGIFGQTGAQHEKRSKQRTDKSDRGGVRQAGQKRRTIHKSGNLLN